MNNNDYVGIIVLLGFSILILIILLLQIHWSSNYDIYALKDRAISLGYAKYTNDFYGRPYLVWNTNSVDIEK